MTLRTQPRDQGALSEMFEQASSCAPSITNSFRTRQRRALGAAPFGLASETPTGHFPLQV